MPESREFQAAKQEMNYMYKLSKGDQTEIIVDMEVSLAQRLY